VKPSQAVELRRAEELNSGSCDGPVVAEEGLNLVGYVRFTGVVAQCVLN